MIQHAKHAKYRTMQNTQCKTPHFVFALVHFARLQFYFYINRPYSIAAKSSLWTSFIGSFRITAIYFILSFKIRIMTLFISIDQLSYHLFWLQHIIKSQLSNIAVSPCPFHVIPPLKDPNIVCRRPFIGFNKSNLASAVFQQLITTHRVNYSNILKRTHIAQTVGILLVASFFVKILL